MKGIRQIPLTILYVEDDAVIRKAVSLFLGMLCARLVTAGDGLEALELARSHRPHLLVTDIRIPHLGGLELARKLEELLPGTPVVITTAFTEIPLLLQAIELGVSGFVRKPLNYRELEAAIRRAAVPVLQRAELERLSARRSDELAGYLGGAACLKSLLPRIVEALEAETPVVIQGERGSGKTMLATLLHRLGARSRRPCVTVECRPTSPAHLETELLGSRQWGIGRLAAAAGGTLILAGIEEMPLPVQAKLLKILEAGSYYPLGDATPLPVSCRVVATVRSPLAHLVAQRKVNMSLATCLAGRTLSLPPLREYGEDFAAYSLHFLAEAAGRYREPPVLEPEAMAALKRYRWPDNLRELKRVMHSAVITAPGRITAGIITDILAKTPGNPAQIIDPPPTIRFDELARWAIREALARTGGRKMPAAELLGIDYKRFKRKLELYGIKTP